MEIPKERILESLIRKEHLDYFVIDEKGLLGGAKGAIYVRNDQFEAGFGNLYEIIGQLNPEVVAAHKKEMNLESVFFVDESNREEWLRAINTGWTPWSETLRGIEKYL